MSYLELLESGMGIEGERRCLFAVASLPCSLRFLIGGRGTVEVDNRDRLDWMSHEQWASEQLRR